MSEKPSKIQCPHCGCAVITVYTQELTQLGITEVVQGIDEIISSILDRTRTIFTDVELAEANRWVDMPSCPECGNVFQLNIETHETRP